MAQRNISIVAHTRPVHIRLHTVIASKGKGLIACANGKDSYQHVQSIHPFWYSQSINMANCNVCAFLQFMYFVINKKSEQAGLKTVCTSNNPILVTAFPEWLKFTEPWTRTPGYAPVVVVVIVFLHARVQFCRFNKANATVDGQ